MSGDWPLDTLTRASGGAGPTNQSPTIRRVCPLSSGSAATPSTRRMDPVGPDFPGGGAAEIKTRPAPSAWRRGNEAVLQSGRFVSTGNQDKTAKDLESAFSLPQVKMDD